MRDILTQCGQALRIAAIAVLALLLATGGHAYAAVTVNAVYLYDLSGPTKDSKFHRQSGLFCDVNNSEVYVVDTGNHCVRIFSKEGMQVFQFGRNGELNIPLDIAVNSAGDAYVLQSGLGGSNIIDVFDYRGKYLQRLELTGLPEGETCDATDIAMDAEDNIYLADQRAGCVFSFDADGRYRFKILPPLTDKESEEVVFGNMMIDKDDRLFLPICTLGLVYVFNREGQPVMNFGVQGGGPGKLAFPIDVVVDNHGHLLVLDQQRHCVSVYDPTGQYLTEFGGMGAGPGWFFFPKSLEIDKYGRIYVSQTFGNRVQVLKLKEELE